MAPCPSFGKHRCDEEGRLALWATGGLGVCQDTGADAQSDERHQKRKRHHFFSSYLEQATCQQPRETSPFNRINDGFSLRRQEGPLFKHSPISKANMLY